MGGGKPFGPSSLSHHLWCLLFKVQPGFRATDLITVGSLLCYMKELSCQSVASLGPRGICNPHLLVEGESHATSDGKGVCHLWGRRVIVNVFS